MGYKINPFTGQLDASGGVDGITTDVKYVTSVGYMDEGGDYAVNTSGGSVFFVVPLGFTETFVITDALKSFTSSNYCKITFDHTAQGYVKLVNNNDSYKFYFNYVDDKWYSINLKTKEGRKV